MVMSFFRKPEEGGLEHIDAQEPCVSRGTV